MLFISPNNEYPRHYADIMIQNLGWKIGDDLPAGWVEVQFSEFPALTEDEAVEEGFPIEKDGIYYQNLSVRPLTEEEKALRDRPKIARQKLVDAGLIEAEIMALVKDLRY